MAALKTAGVVSAAKVQTLQRDELDTSMAQLLESKKVSASLSQRDVSALVKPSAPVAAPVAPTPVVSQPKVEIMASKPLVEGFGVVGTSKNMCPDNLAKAFDNAAVTERDDGRSKIQALSTTPVINIRGGYNVNDINLGDALFSAAPSYAKLLPGVCYGVVYAIQGSTLSGVLEVSFEPSGGTFTQLRPGAMLRIPGGASGIVIRRSALSEIVGNARLVVLVAPDVDYEELPLVAGTAPYLSGTASSGTAADAIAGSYGYRIVSTSGGSTGVADTPMAAAVAAGLPESQVGVPINGGTGVRVMIVADSDYFIAGSLQFWYYNPEAELWFKSNNGETWPVGASTLTGVCSADYKIAVPHGRLFASCVNTGTNGGVAEFEQYTQVAYGVS